ncbi:5-oxoprolinase subunit PxpA [Microbacterium rhizomatis]|uniref:LamB/YcsF family protein n=1 Tax=Microbacterium rhizomatis TaxID=1631477 RepID=A0A5J5J355_9MICO|nr:5-oxoprolinase subunit PxpA [Microbacterium rhizomatis]KAA9107860.1 LamB/YcsF family protein [Microbacterium rhizomatis]
MVAGEQAIDLNADLGETIDGVPTADDEAMFAVVSSASIACGGHAGDAASMRAAVSRAVRFGVAAGAHPSYADRANFGRVARDPDRAELRAEVGSQLDALAAAGASVLYVKPHGALYHAITVDEAQADAVAAAVADFGARLGHALPILGLPGKIERAAASAGLPFFIEAFLDRGYLASGALVPRGRPGALLADPHAVADRAGRLVRDGVVETVDGALVEVRAASLCVHGDSPAAVEMARAVRAALAADGVRVEAPW